MKKIVYTLSLFLALAACGQLAAQNNHTQSKTVIFTQTENVNVLRQSISRTITRLQVKRNSSVILFYDTNNYIDVVYNPDESDPFGSNCITIKGMTLIIDDPDGESVYEVHLKKDELQSVDRDSKATIVYARSTNPTSLAYIGGNDTADRPFATGNTGNMALRLTLEEARKSLNEARVQLQEAMSSKEMENARRQLSAAREEIRKALEDSTERYDERIIEAIDTSVKEAVEAGIVATETLEADDEGTDDMDIVNRYVAKSRHAYYDAKSHHAYYGFEERTTFAFLWGFNNWGDKWYNGLSKMDGAYNLKTTFSSWQLEAQYAVVMTRHFNLSVGVGYESDIYKFSTPLVDMDANGVLYDRIGALPNQSYDNFVQNNELFANTHLDDWSTRLVTRYVSLPVTVGLRFNEFNISLTALPALALNTRHTGLKHELDTRNVDHQDVNDISRHISPYKVDLRLDLRYENFGIFLQTSTASLFKEGSPEAFPIKLGFIIKSAIDN